MEGGLPAFPGCCSKLGLGAAGTVLAFCYLLPRHTQYLGDFLLFIETWASYLLQIGKWHAGMVEELEVWIV